MAKADKRAKPWLNTLVKRVRHWLEERPGTWCSAGGVVVNEEGRIALIRQGRRWTLPKGRLDPGETVNRAAHREVYEETGLAARITAYLGVLEGERHDTHYFLMALEKDDRVHDDEVDEVRFVKPSRAKELLKSKSDRLVLKRALDCLKGREVEDLKIRAEKLRTR